jgi:hypothetical protein
MDITYHYPPELISLLIDTIPLLFKGKKDVFLFFRGAGVEWKLMHQIHERWDADHNSVGKHEITRTIITTLNELGEKTLRERREILKRITEFDDFSTCWPDDQLKAQGLVAQIQKLVDVKDSFTRMRLEREHERKKRLEKENADREAYRQRQEAISKSKDELFKLFSLEDPYIRGKAFEKALNQLFRAFEISIRESFTLNGDSGEGIVEQIDGAIAIDKRIYFIEAKWWNAPLGVPEISQHLMRVFLRAETGAIIISASEFSDAAINTCKEALHQKVVVLCTLQEIVALLDQQGDLQEFLKRKIEKAILDKMPYYNTIVK